MPSPVRPARAPTPDYAANPRWGNDGGNVSAQQSTSCSFVRDLAALAPMLSGSRWSERRRLFASFRSAKFSKTDGAILWGRFKRHLTASAGSAWNHGRFANRGQSSLRGQIPPSPRSAWWQRKRSTEHLLQFCQRSGGSGSYAMRLSMA